MAARWSVAVIDTMDAQRQPIGRTTKRVRLLASAGGSRLIRASWWGSALRAGLEAERNYQHELRPAADSQPHLKN